METYIVRHSLDMVLQLRDTTTGKSILEHNVVFRKDGNIVFLANKGGGVYVIMDTPRINTQYEIEVYGYETQTVSVEYGESKKSYRIIEVPLIPKERMNPAIDYVTIKGRMDGIEHLEAVSLNAKSCFLQEYIPKKQQLIYYGNMELAEQEYALLNKGKQEYQCFQIKKAITKTGVTIWQPLNQPCAVNDPIVRIVRGQIGGAGDYLLRLRITDDSDTYLVRYVVNGQTYYQTVNSQETERELGK